MRLAHEDGGDEEDRAAQDDQYPECPPPAQVNDSEASDEWSENLGIISVRAQQR